ncbi:MAG: hypothetical protein ACK4Y5_06485 [Acetobacteraceae bacterium]|jgi:hypothetical protein
MSHIHEVAEAERQRAIYDSERGTGYVAAASPVVVGYVKPAAETDIEARARLAQEVGRLEAELRKAREAATTAAHGCALTARKAGGTPMTLTVRGTDVTVCIINEGDGPDDWYIGGIWTGLDWLDADLLDIDWMDDAIDAVRAVWREDEIAAVPAKYRVEV